MNRELVRCPEGYWNLIDDRGTLLCRFKIGDKVMIDGNTDGWIDSIEFCKDITFIHIRWDNQYMIRRSIQRIESMEVFT